MQFANWSELVEKFDKCKGSFRTARSIRAGHSRRFRNGRLSKKSGAPEEFSIETRLRPRGDYTLVAFWRSRPHLHALQFWAAALEMRGGTLTRASRRSFSALGILRGRPVSGGTFLARFLLASAKAQRGAAPRKRNKPLAEVLAPGKSGTNFLRAEGFFQEPAAGSNTGFDPALYRAGIRP